MSVLLIAVLLVVGILLYNPAKSFGIPAALIFMGVGLFLGNQSSFVPAYDYPGFTEKVSQFALGIIIFSGGLHTPVKRIRPVLGEGLVLSNLAVLITAASVGVFAAWVTPLTLAEGLLLGAVVSSTDAAAVFSILESKKIQLKNNADKALEFESATNDPMAMILTLAMTTYLLEAGNVSIGYYLLFFIQQLGVGIVVGVLFGLILRLIFARLKFTEEGLIPILLISMLLVATSGADLLGGNVLMTSYVLGLTISDAKIPKKTNSLLFFNSFSWLAQTAMFLLLGLQLFPDSMVRAVSWAWLPTLFLFFIGRPLGVMLSYLPFCKVPLRKRVFVSWIGLKGATPIVFALIPLIAGVPQSRTILNIVAVIVIASMLVHGFTLKPAARVLGLLKEDSE